MKPAVIPRPPKYKRLRGDQRDKPLRDYCKATFRLNDGVLSWATGDRAGFPVSGWEYEGHRYIWLDCEAVALDEIVDLLHSASCRENKIAKGYKPLDPRLLDHCRNAFRLDETRTKLLHNKPLKYRDMYLRWTEAPPGEEVVGRTIMGRRYIKTFGNTLILMDEVIAALAAYGDKYVFKAACVFRSCMTGELLFEIERDRFVVITDEMIMGWPSPSEARH